MELDIKSGNLDQRSMVRLTRLRLARERQALTQLELAIMAGLTPTTISKLERGESEARMPTLRKLAAALGVKPADLFDQEAQA